MSESDSKNTNVVHGQKSSRIDLKTLFSPIQIASSHGKGFDHVEKTGIDRCGMRGHVGRGGIR